uniref:Interleukin-1 receptor-associated kinase 3 n=1 Tax=Cynoglossus semilaevis TaxID=244447 RepID=A0A3P8WGG6_CYNSE
MDAFLYDLPPLLMEELCRILDSGGDILGWRGLAVRIVPDYSEVRRLERLEAAGRSPSRELLWSWAQQNTRVTELLTVLQDMGHYRALQLLQGPKQSHSPLVGDAATPSTMTQVVERQPPVITLRDIIEGSKDFHPGMKISESDFATVYRAHVGDQTYAVKLFKQVQSLSWKTQWDAFLQEMEVHRVYHPNILHPIGCFSDEGNYCLVYPYLPNGSLYHRLHQQVNHTFHHSFLLKVLRVHHLHTAPSCSVICGNISSANILLDHALQPQLSDFGLARLRPSLASQCCTDTVSRGFYRNQGYLPEEFIRHQRLSFSLDVYSFGMVIMETITGRQVIEYEPKQPRDVLDAAVEQSGGSLDSCLQFLDQTAGQWPTAVALSLLSLALKCTASRHNQRPAMEDVLLSLSQLLPSPSGPPPDQPHSLNVDPTPPSLPVEHDEESSLPGLVAEDTPLECSQSEVTFLSSGGGTYSEVELDLYSSCPVQCSCSGEEGGLPCEDCRANTLISGTAQTDRVVENEAKCKLRNKLSLYNRQMIDTPELFSETDGNE